MSDTPRTDEAQFGTGRVSADFARTLERSIPTWTPTADLAALPPFDTYVLVYTTKEFRTIAVRSYNGLGRGWTWRGNGRMYSHDEITHWTPMPEAPEKEVAK